ncbi:MAG: hypothetical protein JW761_05070, partial [Prolixibacteraceae bacterium]|nr:hypothetical protein [Prolixibacteraceae bacterium]
MIKYSKLIWVLLIGLQLVFGGCQKEEYELGELITPTNIMLNYEIKGANSENPYGDGSGVVNFTATAD